MNELTLKTLIKKYNLHGFEFSYDGELTVIFDVFAARRVVTLHDGKVCKVFSTDMTLDMYQRSVLEDILFDEEDEYFSMEEF